MFGLVSVGVLALALILALVDYNRFIQIPYWSLFSACYLFPNSYDICSILSIRDVAAKTMQYWDWKLEKVEPSIVVPIEEIQAADFSYERLKRISKNFAYPVVVRGLFKDAQALAKWNTAFFEEKYGEDILIVLNEGRTDEQYAVNITKRDDKSYSKVMQASKMKLKNAIRRMKEGQKLYVANVDTIFRRNNELLDQLEFSRFIKPWAYDPYEPYACQMFFGFGDADPKETTGTMMHAAASANFFVQVAGKKTWTFVHPRFSIMLKPGLGAMTPAARVAELPEEAPKMRTVLSEGDCLFNPPWMWHEIRNGPGLNIGVATRENHMPWVLQNNALFSWLLEFRATPRVAKLMIPKDQKALRVVASVPFLSMSISYVMEKLLGPQKFPLFTAAYNPCDEHDPRSCNTTLLDKTVYNEDVSPLPYVE